MKIILLLGHLQSPLFYYFSWDLFLWKSNQRKGCLILPSQMFHMWWNDGGHRQLLYQVQDQAGNREDCYEKGRRPGRRLHSGLSLEYWWSNIQFQVSELEKSDNCANMRGAEVCLQISRAIQNDMIFHQAGLPDLLSHHHTLRTRVRLALVRHAGGNSSPI